MMDLIIKGTKNGLLYNNNFIGGNGIKGKTIGIRAPKLPKALKSKGGFAQMDHFQDIFGKVLEDFDNEDDEISLKKDLNMTDRIETTNKFGPKWDVEK